MNGLTRDQASVLVQALDSWLDGHGSSSPEYDRTLASAMADELGEFLDAFRGDVVLDMWTDGAARPTNPGPAGIGVVGKIGDKTVIEIAEYIGRTTNNVAEYKAVVKAMRSAVDAGARQVVIHSDSKLVVEQYHGRWKCKDESLIPLLGRIKGLVQRFDTFELKWVPREKNREADGLSVAGAYKPRDCGSCRHAWHTAFCTEPDNDNPGTACGCPFGMKGGLSA